MSVSEMAKFGSWNATTPCGYCVLHSTMKGDENGAGDQTTSGRT